MYSGTEPAVELQLAAAIETDSVFEVPLLSIPKGAVPVYDEQLHAVVGYRRETTTGVFRLYDLEANYVGMEEVGLLQHVELRRPRQAAAANCAVPRCHRVALGVRAARMLV